MIPKLSGALLWGAVLVFVVAPVLTILFFTVKLILR